jgi:hypothetical protein
MHLVNIYRLFDEFENEIFAYVNILYSDYFFWFYYFDSLSLFFFLIIFVAFEIQGIQDKIHLVPIDLQNRPAWYKEKVYSENKVCDYNL